MAITRIGFVGLGIMGRPMARSLIRAGFDLTVYSRSRGPVDEIVAAGARAAGSAAEVARASEVTITMLPDSPDVVWREPMFRGYAAWTRQEPFRAALERVLAAGDGTVVMCSEAVWWRCHRRLIADVAVLLHDVPVLHLMHDGRLSPHQPMAGARVTPAGLVYDDGALPV